MFKHIAFFCLFALAMQGNLLYGQTFTPVRFRFGIEMFPNNYETARQKSPELNEIANGRYARYIQSTRLLSTRERTALSEAGVQILEYIQFGVYLVSIPEQYDLGQLAPLQVQSILPVQPVWKLARNLREPPYGEWAVFGDRLAVNVQIYPHVSLETAVDLCKKSGLEVLKTGTTAHFIQILIPQNNLENIAALPMVQYMELLPPPPVPEDTRGRSLHRSNMLDSDAPTGKKYNGSGVSVLVRDNGRLAPHIDFKGRLTNFSTAPPETHGIGVSGILTGAGNLDPTKKGMAAGVNLFAVDYTNDFQDATLDLFLNENATITNSSYGDGIGCNGGYTLNTQIVDGQMYTYPTLTHVFSAGNSNGSDCGENTYGAGNQWGNITGGHKQGKNSIAVANLLSNTNLDNTSSRGPAYDGRIKPDISANGNSQETTAPNNTYQVFGGTSGAAPGIAGCLAQLTHAYKTLHGGQEPSAALLKTLILNTANDLGNAGPDFKFGWGHVNAGRALRQIEEAHWSENAVDNGQTVTQNLVIPAGVQQAKVMLYWAETPASELAAKALINDLDLTLTSSSGTVYEPWKLDPTPNPVILNTPAIKGRDSLNNMEQVAILNPPAGSYTISISGTEVPLGPQPFFLAWEFLTDSIVLTYPNGGEGFVPGETERIYWDAFGSVENFVLRYATDGGANWQTITTLAATARFYDWIVPGTVSGNVRIQIQRGSQTDTNDAAFSIAEVPQNIVITKVCPDSMRISWTDINDTLSYDAYLLGNKYMELAGSSAINSISIPIESPNLEQWVSVRCTSASGITGRRAIAVRWSGGLKNCQQQDDLTIGQALTLAGDTVLSCTPTSRVVKIRIVNNGTQPISGAILNYQVDNQEIVSEPLPNIAIGATLDFSFQNELELSGNQSATLRVWSTYPLEDYVYNDTLSVPILYVTQPTGTYFTEDFEDSALLPSGWLIKNPDAGVDGITWQLSSESVTGAGGTATRALFLDYYNYNSPGEEDYVYLQPLDLSNISNPALTFDIAHARFNNSSVESLRVEVFPGCNPQAAPVIVWQKSDPALATVPGSGSVFHPDNAQDWRREYVNLQAFAGQSVFVRFAAVNDYGNSLYLDNINLENFETPEALVSVSKDSVCRNDTVYFEAVLPGTGTLNYVWSFGANASPIAANGPGPHAVRYLIAGNKTPQLIASNAFAADTAHTQVFVQTFPTSNFTFQASELEVAFNNTSQNATTYFWTFGDDSTSTEINPVHTYAGPGTYNVQLSATNDCSSVDKTTVVVLTTGTSDIAEQMGVKILPNPTAGDFRVELESRTQGPVRLSLLDTQGRLVKTIETIVKQSVTTVSFENLNLAAGVYQLNVRTESGFQTFSIVVQ